jgi:hypothetical protein
MKVLPLASFKQLLTSIGARVPARRLHQIQMIVNYMKLGRWMSDHDFRFQRRVSDRMAVFAAIAERVRHQRVLYLEFGVFKGASIRFWSHELKHPEARLHGFDSFEGLPEDFDLDAGPHKKGAFDVGGAVPDISDSRVQFFNGWFDQVLPTYCVPEHDVLVINIDADLYSSAIYVLRHLRPHIKPGTFIYFDDMSRPEHEPRAFDELMKETGLRFRPVCADKSLNCACFQCVG